MDKPKVAVVGASAEQLEEIKKLLGGKGIDIVEVSEADAVVDPDWVFSSPRDIKYIKTELVDEPNEVDTSYDDGKQHWRGGARGRKGKIKYERR